MGKDAVVAQQEILNTPVNALDSDVPILGRIGSLQTRLARTITEVQAAQALRYDIFYGEMGGTTNVDNLQNRRDEDRFDSHCDHLLVIDTKHDRQQIVGTYRMMMPSHAEQAGGFYTQSEFDLQPLFSSNADARVLELGRSCILPTYRNKRTMELLWHGTWAYAVARKIDIMFGCASFGGIDPNAISNALSWLGKNAAMKKQENCPAVVPDSVALASFDSGDVDLREAMKIMPPLIKGYLRLGAQIGSHAVIDRLFGTIDVLVVLKVAQINPRYLAHYGVDASRYSD